MYYSLAVRQDNDPVLLGPIRTNQENAHHQASKILSQIGHGKIVILRSKQEIGGYTPWLTIAKKKTIQRRKRNYI